MKRTYAAQRPRCCIGGRWTHPYEKQTQSSRPALGAVADDRSNPRSRRLLQLHYVVQRVVGGLEEAPDSARRLADALLVLDEREADEIVAVLAEANARRDGDVGLLDQQFRELE